MATAVWWSSTHRAPTLLPTRESPTARIEPVPTLATAVHGHEICIYPSTVGIPHGDILTDSFRNRARSSSTVRLLDIVLRNSTSEPWSVDGSHLALEDVSTDAGSRVALENPANRLGGFGAPAVITIAPGNCIRWIRAIPIEVRWRGEPGRSTASSATMQLIGLKTTQPDGRADQGAVSLVASDAYQSSLEQWRSGSGGSLDDVLVDHPLSKVGR